MALFKMLRGDKANIGTAKTPFHDGYAYFTPEDGGFYIDAEVADAQKRIRVNPPSASWELTLLGAGWVEKEQTVEVEGLTAGANGAVGLSSTCTEAQVAAASAAGIRVTSQGDGTLTFAAAEAPSVDIPVTLVTF